MSKKQIRTLLILACVALLLGAALFVLRYEKTPELLPPLVQISADEIDQLCFSYRDHPINLQLQDGQWYVLLPEMTLPAKQDMVNTLVSTLCEIRPQQQLEQQDLEQIPMTVQQATIDILSGSGTNEIKASQQITVGSMNAITDQLYVQVADRVYLTDTTILEILSVPALDFLQQASIPKPDNHQSVTVENAMGIVELSCVGSQTGGEEGIWYVKTGDSWTQADQDQAYNFYFLTWDMHWKSTAGYLTDNTQLADYGLDNPQAVYTLIYGGESFTLRFGQNLPDGTTYVICDGSSLVYTMDTLLAQWLAQATAAPLLPTIS